MLQRVCMPRARNKQACTLLPGLPQTMSDKRDTHESCSQTIWKYSCLSRTNQRHYKAIASDLAQNELKKKKETLPTSPCSNEKERKELLKAGFLGGQNKEGSNAAQGEMRFSNTAMREIQPGCNSEPHCKLRRFLHGNKAYFHLLMNILKNAIRVRAPDNGELSEEK